MSFLLVLRGTFREFQQLIVVGFPFPEAMLSNCFQNTALILFCTVDATMLPGKEFEFANTFTWGKQKECMKVNWDHSCSTTFIYEYAKLVSLNFPGNYLWKTVAITGRNAGLDQNQSFLIFSTAMFQSYFKIK